MYSEAVRWIEGVMDTRSLSENKVDAFEERGTKPMLDRGLAMQEHPL